MSDPYQHFMTCLKVSDDLIEQSSKDLLAETARVLALMVAALSDQVRGDPGRGVAEAASSGDAQRG